MYLSFNRRGVQAYTPSTWEAEAGGLLKVQGQPGLCSTNTSKTKNLEKEQGGISKLYMVLNVGSSKGSINL